MSQAQPERTAPPARRRLRFGLRTLLAAILLVALPLGWVAREHHRAAERSALVAELTDARVRVVLAEPTNFGLWVRKRLPGREAWVRDRIGDGWFSVPTAFDATRLDDERVPFALARLGRLGTVREVYFHGGRTTEAGVSALRSGLPGVNVVPWRDTSRHHYLNAQGGEHFAFGPAAFEASLALWLLGIVAWAAWSLARRLRRRAAA
jgi:hypothetical protein